MGHFPSITTEDQFISIKVKLVQNELLIPNKMVHFHHFERDSHNKEMTQQ